MGPASSDGHMGSQPSQHPPDSFCRSSAYAYRSDGMHQGERKARSLCLVGLVFRALLEARARPCAHRAEALCCLHSRMQVCMSQEIQRLSSLDGKQKAKHAAYRHRSLERSKADHGRSLQEWLHKRRRHFTAHLAGQASRAQVKKSW